MEWRRHIEHEGRRRTRIQAMQGIQGIQDIQDIQDTQDVQDTQDIQDIQAIQDIQDYSNIYMAVYPSLTCANNSSLSGLNTRAPSIWSKARLACPISESTNAYLERAWK